LGGGVKGLLFFKEKSTATSFRHVTRGENRKGKRKLVPSSPRRPGEKERN